MKKNYYSVFSHGKSYDNLIDLRSRPLEERREIARKGGLARQEQRRKQLAFKKTLEAFFEVDDFIGTYNKKNKSRNFTFNNGNLSKSGANFLNCILRDSAKALENYDKELQKEEAKRQKRKKAIRKKINRRYYLKRKKRLKKT